MSWTDTMRYLTDRGEPYGIGPLELLEKTPAFIQGNADAVLAFWQDKHISHIIPTSIAPELADDPSNWIPEDPHPNHARGDDTMDFGDQLAACIDNLGDALHHMIATLT